MNKKSYKIIVNLFYQPVDELKKYLIEHKDVLIPILGGSITNPLKNDEWVKNNCLFDDTGDNISDLNKNINEMTTIYWAWKHYDEIGNPEYIGFNHYRRFFDLETINKEINENNVDLICKNPDLIRVGIIKHYELCHVKEDYEKLSAYMKKKFFDKEHNNWYDEFVSMSNGLYLYGCNMFVMRKEIFFEYCQFMFPILADIIPIINVSGRDNYQKRAVSFLSERLTSLFIMRVMKDGYRIKPLPIDFKKEWKNNNFNERGTY